MRKTLISRINSDGSITQFGSKLKVEQYFKTITPREVKRYSKYWESITPRNKNDILKRWLFAFMSIHTTWENNVTGYKAVNGWRKWFGENSKLRHSLIQSRVGLHNMRTKYISKFVTQFLSEPERYERKENETWQEWRNRMVKENLGIGIAKVSFVLEMCFPLDCEVVCVDTHTFQMYGLDQSKDANRYEEIESHWLGLCKKHGVPSPIARAIYWDRKQGKINTRYWSYVFEKDRPAKVLN